MSIQEKFQIVTPPNLNESKESGEWAEFRSVRYTGDADGLHKNNNTSADTVDGKFNFLPPGMDIGGQERACIEHMDSTLSGETDVSQDTNPDALSNGFKRQNMIGTDDQYTGEHVDHFYGVVVDEDDHKKEGFCERNNYMDRL